MKRLLRFLIGGAVVFGVALVLFAFALSYESACPTGASAPPPEGMARMRAVQQHCYGGPETLRLEEMAKPVPSAHELLVAVHVASVNPLDWHYLRGQPFVMRLSSGMGAPNGASFGVDFAGVVEAVGDSVTGFAPGDSVFGSHFGAFAEYLTVGDADGVAHMAHGGSFDDFATLGVAATTALQAVRDRGQVTQGQRVLVNGASGGVGTFAVQVAKWRGAHVTGVASARNLELLQTLGADATVDYTASDFTRDTARFDVIIDMVGNHAPSALRRVLRPGGRVVLVGGPELDRWLGPVRTMAAYTAYDRFVPESFAGMLATTTQADLTTLAGLVSNGTLRPVIDRRFTLDQVREAVAYQENGRSRGKNLLVIRETAAGRP